MTPRAQAEPPLLAGVVILAAGASRRMGRPKLLLPWGATSVLGHLVDQWGGLAAQLTVVCAAHDGTLHGELERLGVTVGGRILNPDPERGMFSSIQCAARWRGWNPELNHWVIALGDQPHVMSATLRRLLDSAAANPERVCQPARQGRARHPVVLPRPEFEALGFSTAASLKDFLLARSPGPLLCECDDPGLDFDLDEPADYERALRLCFGRETKA
jgi:molybdenum cofactor cytidylyltransferase